MTELLDEYLLRVKIKFTLRQKKRRRGEKVKERRGEENEGKSRVSVVTRLRHRTLTEPGISETHNAADGAWGHVHHARLEAKQVEKGRRRAMGRMRTQEMSAAGTWQWGNRTVTITAPRTDIRNRPMMKKPPRQIMVNS